MPMYSVRTEKFGDVMVVFDTIKLARADARRRFGIKNPALVRAVRTYALCDTCDSKPCVCP